MSEMEQMTGGDPGDFKRDLTTSMTLQSMLAECGIEARAAQDMAAAQRIIDACNGLAQYIRLQCSRGAVLSDAEAMEGAAAALRPHVDIDADGPELPFWRMLLGWLADQDLDTLGRLGSLDDDPYPHDPET